MLFSNWCSFSSDYSSVHGERPSAEYAKLRKESLESQFGRALGSKSVSVAYHFGPFLALYRAAIISFHVLKLTVWHFFVHDMKKRSIKVSSIILLRCKKKLVGEKLLLFVISLLSLFVLVLDYSFLLYLDCCNFDLSNY